MTSRGERAMTFERFMDLLIRERNADWPGKPIIEVRHKGGRVSTITGIDVDPINEPNPDEPGEFETVGATIYIEVE